MEEILKLSVHNLVDFILRSGSIDNRFGGANRMLEGSRLHRKLQKAEGPDYQAEVSLSYSCKRQSISYLVQGRADGIFTENTISYVDEIKTTLCPCELITEDFDRAHWGQGMCYAYFYAIQEQLAEIGVRLTYLQAETEEIKRFTRLFTIDELSEFFEGLLSSYELWANRLKDWTSCRNESIMALSFPFASYRQGQRKLAASVYCAIKQKQRLFCEAPTGTGKTISTLFPAIKAMGEGMGERIIYLTAKTITRTVAEDAFIRMQSQGLRMKTVTLTAKDKICFLEERECNPEKCPYADGYYNRINDVLFQMLQAEDQMNAETIITWAKKYKLCPFELSLDLTVWCDAVICDYNYLFDPVVYLKRLFLEEGDSIFLIDEAHNLVERSREMYSARLSDGGFRSLKKKCRTEKPLLASLKKITAAFAEQGKRLEDEKFFVEEVPSKEFLNSVFRFSSELSQWLEENKSHSLHSEVLSLYFEVLFFLQISELYDEHYKTYLLKEKNTVTVSLLCLDPSEYLDASMKKGRASILFSATLSPMPYYILVLGGKDSSKTCRLNSPFDSDNLLLLVDDQISTKYSMRQKSLHQIADLLFLMISGKSGNYFAFFPSYAYLREVYAIFREVYPEVDTLMQEEDMPEEKKSLFLAEFQSGEKKARLGFCVMGGIFSEGIDLLGDQLLGAAIIGVGLPGICTERDILKEYFQEKYQSGYDFSYRYPGMNKVLQSAGRVIRSEKDRGVILLIDSRFTSGSYLPLYPAHWRHVKRIGSEQDFKKLLKGFWKNEENLN